MRPPSSKRNREKSGTVPFPSLSFEQTGFEEMERFGSDGRDEFPIPVKRILALRVNYRCSNPQCGAATTGPQTNPAKATNVRVAARITAALPGGPRYDPSLSKQQRGYAENGIWLCQVSGKLVDDDTSGYSVQVLRGWKRIAEDYARTMIGVTSAFSVAPAFRSRENNTDAKSTA